MYKLKLMYKVTKIYSRGWIDLNIEYLKTTVKVLKILNNYINGKRK